MTNRLFKDGDLRTFFEQRRVRMLQEIERFDPNRLQSASTEELTKYFYERYLVDPVQLLRDAAELDDPPREVQIPAEHFPNMFRARPGMTVAGLRYVLRVPFEGHEGLFRYQPSTFTYSGTPTAEIEGQQVVLSSDHLSTESPETVRAGFVSVIDDIAKHLEWVKADVSQWLPTLRQAAWQAIDARKQKLSAGQNAVARMGFKLKERSDAPKTFAAPEVRRKVQPAPAPGSLGFATAYKPEPALIDADYEHILSLIASMSTVLERSPHAFATMDEESLRFLLLVPLNSHYEGQVSGETFNFEGKTDILIRVQGKTIFIAECKIWRGEKALLETIDQLLGYTSWRDTKGAIIIFNRNRGFSAVVNQIKPVVEKHPKFKHFDKQVGETAFRFAFKQRDDEAREMVLTVMAFDVPIPQVSAATPLPVPSPKGA